ncbi:hypothetical protein FAF44_02685 [Nonomuraea sp. MG754425]|uniref:hypothetical protein n=1 Tax=Nonomuraea sp. MG754425 TaxID=2570319 RepID=UPI001F436267|nr:hypothetical protein [Nonomuraea sp. MG754425]MCF6467320.1 hypothetical protein [Nonomuraea sp. MG754425]
MNDNPETGNPLNRPSWYTTAELDAVQLVPTGLEDGRYLVLVAGDLLGTVGPARSGWPARRRSGTTIERATTLRHTRAVAVAELLADVERLWHACRDVV